MDPPQFQQWVVDRADCDDDIEDALADHISQLLDEGDMLEEMAEVLNRTHGG